MAKVFRLTSGQGLEHWADSQVLDGTVIESISTKDGDNTRKEPTSIPSPFARLDLIRTAFKIVAENNDLNGTSVHHKMVSDTLDLLELSFNYDNIPGLSISYWDKKSHLKLLTESNDPKHRLYGETLALYLSQDNESFNFNEFNGFYIFKYNHQVIGGTSPMTLFFTSANNLFEITKGLRINNNDVLFDNDYCPLFNRDVEFIKYVFSLFAQHPLLKNKMVSFYNYLEATLKKLNATNFELYNEINLFTEGNNYLSNCKTLTNGVGGQDVEIFGIPLYKRSGEMPIESESEFLIYSDRFKNLYPDQKQPLVLQNNFNKSLKYTSTTSTWDLNFKVPYVDDNALEERSLPGVIVKYPYLTVSDFLEPVIFEFDYALNSKAFYNGISKDKENSDVSYTLPLTNRFFDFYTIDDLMNKKINGNPMLEITAFSASVEVVLRIPINGGSDVITFTRKYDSKEASFDNDLRPDLVNNKGVIEKLDAAIAIYPFVKSEFINEYRIGLYKMRDYNVKLNYYNSSNTPNRILASKLRGQELVKSSYDLVEKSFEYITISQFDYQNIIVPKWKIQKAKNDVYTFAIDFGTTNTHIEYQINNSEPKAFEIVDNDIQYQSTIDPEFINIGDVSDALDMHDSAIIIELMPALINLDSDYNFPIRTVLTHKKDLNKSVPTFSLMDYSIPFVYQKKVIPLDNDIKSNLKWSKQTNLDVEKYLEELILLLKNKVVFNNGDLDKTKIRWSYPLSMSKARLINLESVFEDLIEKHFGDNVEIEKFSESLVPFQYLIKKQGIVSLNKPVASIDMGGGTVDMVIYFKNEPQLITSFKLGVNTLFGNGYNKSKELNAYKRFYEEIIKSLINNNKSDLESIAGNLLFNSNDFTDLATFAFSLENNKELMEENIEISFNKMLSASGDLIIVFLLYYSSMIYHLAKIMKLNNLESPNAITFTGNGSRILNVIDSSKKSKILSELTALIFEKVYQQDVDSIKIGRYDNPKEMTAKGMIYASKDYKINDLSFTLIGDVNNTTSDTYENVENYIEDVEIEFSNFIDLFFDLNKDFSFTDNFEISQTRLNEFKSFIKSTSKDELLLGIHERVSELNNQLDTPINESLFFYPLIGILNSLATHIIEDDYEK